MRPAILWPLVALTLLACERRNEAIEAPAAATPAAPAAEAQPQAQVPALPAVQPVTARGTEPFWAAEADAHKVVVTRPDHPPLELTVSVDHADGRTIWFGNGGALTVNTAPCSDGMSDVRYPMSAELRLAAETLKGCAFPTNSPPAAPGPGG